MRLKIMEIVWLFPGRLPGKKMKNGRCEKLECKLNNKVFIQKAVNHGIKLENIYKVIKFN